MDYGIRTIALSVDFSQKSTKLCILLSCKPLLMFWAGSCGWNKATPSRGRSTSPKWRKRTKGRSDHQVVRVVNRAQSNHQSIRTRNPELKGFNLPGHRQGVSFAAALTSRINVISEKANASSVGNRDTWFDCPQGDGRAPSVASKFASPRQLASIPPAAMYVGHASPTRQLEGSRQGLSSRVFAT